MSLVTFTSSSTKESDELSLFSDFMIFKSSLSKPFLFSLAFSICLIFLRIYKVFYLFSSNYLQLED